MHINGRGHRPLTCPFSRGRGTGLCEIGFNDPIVDCVMPRHTVHTVYCTLSYPDLPAGGSIKCYLILSHSTPPRALIQPMHGFIH